MDNPTFSVLLNEAENTTNFSVDDGTLVYLGGLEASTDPYTVTVVAEEGDTSISADFALTVIATPVVNPSIALSNIVTSLTATQAVNGARIAGITLTDMGENVQYTFTVDGQNSTAFKVANNQLLLNGDLAAGTYANIVVTANDGINTVNAEAFNLNVVNPGPAQWNISGLGYASYVLTASPDNNVSASLFGTKADSTLELISTFTNLGQDAKATITGDAGTAENVFIRATAMQNLGEIVFNGGNSCGARDNLTIEGTAGQDEYTIDSKVTSTTAPVINVNPYANLLNFYRNIYGANSPIFKNIERCYNNAFAHMNTVVRTTQSAYGVVELTNGAEVQFTGVDNATINALGGDDTFKVNSLGARYTLIGGTESDTIDFSNARQVVIDMGSTENQYAIPGQIGSIRMVNDIENITGTANTDRITGSALGTTINGNGGSDVIVLVGGNNTVNLTGGHQSVVIRGNGTYTINILRGDFSVINAAATTRDATVNLTAAGRNITLLGGFGTVTANITGDFAVLNCATTRQANLNVVGNFATILGGAGDDRLSITGNNGRITAGAGNDAITYSGSNGFVFGGLGDDIIILANNGFAAGNNFIYAEDGNDIVYAALATGRNYFYAGTGNDIIVGSAGDDLIYGMTGNNALIGMGGADRIFGGTGRDVLMASRGSNMVGLETSTPAALAAFFGQLTNDWIVNGDTTRTIALLGAASVADGSRDWLFRGSGRRDLFYTNFAADGDFENAFEFQPFFDTLIDP